MFKKVYILPALFITLVIASPLRSLAWGREGHQIVGTIASHFLDDSTRKKVEKYLGGTSFEDAATWMDESRSNEYYDFMRTWHYVNMEKGETFKQAADKNAVSVLHAAINELRNIDKLSKSRIRTDLYIIFHLIGDLHQPMHVGYGSDRGGNNVQVSYLYKSYKTNLHSVWDTEIIQSEKITADTCLKLYSGLSQTDIDNINKLNELGWMKESRVLLDTAYNFKDNFLDKNYVLSNKTIIEKQLLVAGMRLAYVLKELFKS